MIGIRDLHMHYRTDQGEVHAVRGIDLDIAQGEFFTLLGPSGCGKTTTLRAIAGLETPAEGEIAIDGEPVYSAAQHINVAPHRRDIGMVFQSYAIWPHMNVFENVAFPLREMGGMARTQIRDRVLRALSLVQLEGYEDRPAPFLSGGQQQRLALARALVKEPKVLLLDEPLSNLDAKLREEMRGELRALVKRLGITTVYVTHDQLEALTMSDVVAVMDHGTIMQQSTPYDIYEAPANRFVAGFIGQINIFEGRVSRPANGSGRGTVTTACGALDCWLPADAATGDAVSVVVRPEDIHLEGAAPGNGAENRVDGTVAELVFLGEALDCQVAAGDSRLRLKLHPTTRLELGQTVSLAIPVERCRALVD